MTVTCHMWQSPHLNKLPEHALNHYNPYELKQYNTSLRNCQSQLSLPSSSHIKQEYQEKMLQRKICRQ